MKGLPGLPEGAPTGSFPLSPDEASELRHVQMERRFLQSELDKIQILQQNVFLKIQIRTGQDMTGWGIDTQKGLCIPPESRNTPPADPPPANPSETKPS